MYGKGSTDQLLKSRIMYARLTLIVCLTVLTLWVFRGPLLLEETFSFRDTAHFYEPLFRYEYSQWQSGTIPLWNPLVNAGTPLAANPTAAVFYPGKVIFHLGLPWRTAYESYVIAHICLAAGTMYLACRYWSYSREASILAALSYAFSGSVAFQHCNLVFLCGAAWLPLVLLTGERMIRQRDFKWTIGHGLTLAVTTLAGDMQTAYLGGLASALYAGICWISTRREPGDPTETPASSRIVTSSLKSSADGSQTIAPSRGLSWNRSYPVLLCSAAILALLAASVQVLPTLELSGQTTRRATPVPSNIYDIPGYVLSDEPVRARSDTGAPPDWYDTLIGNPPPPGKHDLQIYNFQIEPWRVLEFVFPNISGQMGFRRWLQSLGWEGLTWIPSLYMGLIPFLCAVLSLRWVRGDPHRLWLTWLATLALLAAFGSYTLTRLSFHLFDYHWDGPNAGAVGGVYWLLTVILPGFYSFRYPAKLVVFVAAALSVLAASGLDQSRKTFPVSRRTLTRLTLGAAAATVIAAFLWPAIVSLIEETDRKMLQSDLARLDFVGAFAQASVLFLFLRWVSSRLTGTQDADSSGRRSVRWAVPLILMVTTADLAIAHRHLVETVPESVFEEGSIVAQAIHEHAESVNASPAPPRVFSRFDPALIGPTSVATQTHDERNYLFGNYYMAAGVGATPTPSTFDLNRFGTWFDVLPMETDDDVVFLAARRALDAWGVRYAILPRGTDRRTVYNRTSLGLRTRWEQPQWSADDWQPIPLGEPMASLPLHQDDDPDSEEEPFEVIINESAFPRTWIVHEVTAIPPIDESNQQLWLPLLRSFVFPQEYWFDLRSAALVEDDKFASLARQRSLVTTPDRPESEMVAITDYSPDQVEIECRLDTAGLVVLSDTYYPGWRVDVASNGDAYVPHTILKTNLSMRGVYLTAGTHRIRYSYEPSSFRTGAWLSLAAWGTGLACPVLAVWRRRRRKKA